MLNTEDLKEGSTSSLSQNLTENEENSHITNFAAIANETKPRLNVAYR